MTPPRTRTTPDTQPGSVQRTEQIDLVDEPRTLALALLAFQQDMPRVGKDKEARVPTKSGGSYSYKYADLATVQEAAMPLLSRVGLIFTTAPRRCDDGTYELVATLAHAASDESVEGTLPLFTRGTPQELGSSLTYARRYLLTAMTGLVADEDDDAQIEAQGRERAMLAEPMRTEQGEAFHRYEQTLNGERERAWRRWSASNPDQPTDAFERAICAVVGKPWQGLTPADFAGFWQGMNR